MVIGVWKTYIQVIMLWECSGSECEYACLFCEILCSDIWWGVKHERQKLGRSNAGNISKYKQLA